MMAKVNCKDILEKMGFTLFSTIEYPMTASIFWHLRLFIWLLVIDLGSVLLVKGTKSYYMRGVCEQGELYVRDIPALQDVLEATFPGLHISMIHQRDITESMVDRRLAEKGFRDVGDLNHTLGEKERELEALKNEYDKVNIALTEFGQFESVVKMEGKKDSLLEQGFRQESADLKQRIEEIAAEGKRLEKEIATTKALRQLYQRQASGTAYVFSYHSLLQVASNEKEFIDAVSNIMEEIRQTDAYQVRQKLNYGRLNVPITEVTEPLSAWILEYLGGLSPKELAKCGPQFDSIREAFEEYFMTFPTTDIVLGGSVKDEKKLVGAKVVQTFLQRFEKIPARVSPPAKLPSKGRTVWIGAIMVGDKVTDTPFMLPIDRMLSVFISGRSGSGKSLGARIVVEGAIAHNVRVVILDPRNQAVGLLQKADQPEVLRRYKQFGLNENLARSFDFTYIAPGEGIGRLPADLSDLLSKNTIVSFRGMDDTERCETFANILEAIFDTVAVEESEGIRILIVIEEAHLFTVNRVSVEAKAAAQRATTILDRYSREGRKYGLYAVIVSQTIRDFTRSAATIRSNTATKIFFCNSDREVDYASDYLTDGRCIVGLPTGVCMVCNSEWGEVKVFVRPPFSKVKELSTKDTRKLVSGVSPQQALLEDDERHALEAIFGYYEHVGEHINFTKLAHELGITSMRKLWGVVASLEQKGLVTVKEVPGRGRPKVIIPMRRP